MTSVSITGLQKMISKLNDLGRDVEKIVDESLEKSAYDIKREIEKNIQSVSVAYNGHTYTATDTGNLFRHIYVEKLGLCRYAIGTNVPYAPMVEYGTGSAGDPSVSHTTRPKWVYYNPIKEGYRTAYPQPARPYMRPAFETKKSAVTLNLTNAITKAWAEGVGL